MILLMFLKDLATVWRTDCDKAEQRGSAGTCLRDDRSLE